MLDLNSEVLIYFLLPQPKKGEVPHLTLSTKNQCLSIRVVSNKRF